MPSDVEVTRVRAGVVLRPRLDRVARPFAEITDAQFEDAWELPMRATITAMQDAYRSGIKRIVVVVPTLAMSGGAYYAHVAAPAEALRVLVKSAARQWGADGVTVNAVAVGPAAFIDSPEATGPTSIASPALAGNRHSQKNDEQRQANQKNNEHASNEPESNEREHENSEQGRDEQRVVEFLCSDASSAMTGQTLTVDGGVWM